MPVASPEEALAALDEAYAETASTAQALDLAGFLLDTRCAGWVVQDLLFHQLLDAQRALIAFATPAAAPPDRDAVTYWLDYPPTPGAEPSPEAEFVRRCAAAYASPLALVEQLAATMGAAVRAARSADPDGLVATQGHVLAVPDVVATLVLEAVVHRLDLPFPVATAPSASAVTEHALIAILGAPRPHSMAPDRFVLLAAGRDEPAADEVELLGPAAARLPVLG